MTNPVRIGIIGCGSVLQGGYLPIAQDLQARGLAEVRMACDALPACALLVERLGIPRFTTDYQQVINAPDVDLVLVLTPPAFHYPVAEAALKAGKHVLVEKPLALSLAEAAQLVTLARQSPGILLPAPHIILSQTYQQIGQRLQRGEIGAVYSARGICGHGGPTWSTWFYQADGGGPLFDLAVYNVTSLTGWLGPVQRVSAFTGTAIAERLVNGQPVQATVEDNAQLLLDFGNAAFAVITSSFTIQRYRDATLELYGSRGTIRLRGDDWAPNGYELWQNDNPTWQTIPECDHDWHYLDGLRHLVTCIQQQTQPLITPEHAYHVLEVLLRAREASRTGQAQLVESRFPPLHFG